ncbi:MAG: oxygen-dependent coproporphyrinogen oxidase [Ignavibacteria bacterium]|nr:oxygen-dependent coproporphyrinogen oxidase [Ignavibacteria bacterium]
MSDRRRLVEEFVVDLQADLCGELEKLDGKGTFISDPWKHPVGGGGLTRVLQNGEIFEKGGVNSSAIRSSLSERLARRLNTAQQGVAAVGLSLVLHPWSPMIPTVHANLRYIELEHGEWWFGGGADLTPYYLFEDDAREFHSVWKKICDKHNRTYYRQFKQLCDEYFYLNHRREARGVGGICFDYMSGEFERLFAFVRDCGEAFLSSYVPLVERRREESWGEHEKRWQWIRRGRYVEFNLLYDRGTLFGLETDGRTESIFMSLPPLVRWEYNPPEAPGPREAALLKVLRKPREWV